MPDGRDRWKKWNEARGITQANTSTTSQEQSSPLPTIFVQEQPKYLDIVPAAKPPNRKIELPLTSKGLREWVASGKLLPDIGNRWQKWDEVRAQAKKAQANTTTTQTPENQPIRDSTPTSPLGTGQKLSATEAKRLAKQTKKALRLKVMQKQLRIKLLLKVLKL